MTSTAPAVSGQPPTPSTPKAAAAGLRPPAAPAAKARPIDQAAALGLSEGEWLSGRQTEARVTRLRLPAADILRALPELGPVMALTRNPSCVHEKDGAYANVEVDGPMGLVLNHEIDLRLFLNNWAHGFAVETPLDGGEIRHSLQFFDQAGTAIHKVFARPATDRAAWKALVARFALDAPLVPLRPAAIAAPPAPQPDAAIDLDALRRGWADLKDVHDFFALLRRLKVGRLQALQLAGAPFARPIPLDRPRWLLEQAARREVPIMCFVGNRGCIQIHSGPIHRVVPMGPWLNILDKGFNLHLREDRIAHAFAVWKPQSDSAVHSIELFDEGGELICQLFGERKPGRPELEGWKALVTEVPTL